MSTTTKIRVLSVDDHPLVREGIAAIINGEPDLTVVAQAESGQHQPDVTLLDLRLPDISGIETLIAIRGECPTARVVMLTTFAGDVEVARALSAGAWGYALKSMAPTELATVIRRVSAGKKYIPPDVAARLAEHMGDERLTDRECSVLQYLASGDRNRQIAERLCISEQTVRAHVKNIMHKLGAAVRTHAVVIGLKRGIIQV
jgi:DNA-binding NarL/FixJ family response regulator